MASSRASASGSSADLAANSSATKASFQPVAGLRRVSSSRKDSTRKRVRIQTHKSRKCTDLLEAYPIENEDERQLAINCWALVLSQHEHATSISALLNEAVRLYHTHVLLERSEDITTNLRGRVSHQDYLSFLKQLRNQPHALQHLDCLPDEDAEIEELPAATEKKKPKNKTRRHNVRSADLPPLYREDIRSEHPCYPGWELRRAYDLKLQSAPEIPDSNRPPPKARGALGEANRKLAAWFDEHSVRVLTVPSQASTTGE